MKKMLFTTVLLTAYTYLYAQTYPIDFENGGNGADWAWTVFENNTNPLLEIIDNPDTSALNASARVAKFTANAAGQPWAGTMSSGIGSFSLDTTNMIIKLLVWKPVISDVTLRLEPENSASGIEVRVTNTKINEWEVLVFDFSNRVTSPYDQGEVFTKLVIFPDFNTEGRGQQNVIYFDTITFSAMGTGGVVENSSFPLVAAPTPPSRNSDDVVSIFSDAYTDVGGTNFNVNWAQSTVVTTENIGGNAVLKYASFSYQGTKFDPAVDASAMTMFHVDVWATESRTIQIYAISASGADYVEKAFPLPTKAGAWVGYDIPLSSFPEVDFSDITQFKFDSGNGIDPIYLDNIYFYKGESVVVGSDEPTDNKAPVSIILPQFTFLEDNSLAIPLGKVMVDESPTRDLIWEWRRNDLSQISIVNDIEGGKVTFSASENWFGQETVYLKVTDPFGKSTNDSTVIVVVPVNDPPIANMEVISEKAIENGYEIVLNDLSSDSHDPDGEILTWEWDFGDGHTSTERAPSHRYEVAGSYMITLKVVDDQGAWATAQKDIHAVLTSIEQGGIPKAYSLGQNYPNPFNPSTTIRYELPEFQFVTITVFNKLGQIVATLVNENQSAGSYDVNFDASRLSSDLYFYRIEAGSYMALKKMILIK